MRQTFTTTMPDRVGAFLKASRSIAGAGANITRVSYNKAVDMHILFIEVEGTKDQLSRVERELGAMGYLPDGQRPATVILLEFELEDRPGEVLPVLELIDRFHFNISYISSQENGGACQHFRMGLLVEDEAAVSRFMREASTLCPVRVIHYDHAEKNLDNTAFYLNFAGEVGRRAGLDQQDRRELMVNANQVMQMLDGRDEAPYKTFEYIGKFAAQLDACRGRRAALGDRLRLEAQEEALADRVSRLELWYAALQAGLAALEQAQQDLQSRFAPKIAAEAREILSSLTLGRYDRLLLDRDLSLSAGAAGENTVRPGIWRSDGTVDQLYLALRLAVSRALLPGAPLVLDDALTRFDDRRLAAALELLRREDRQILLFTCQSREARLQQPVD